MVRIASLMLVMATPALATPAMAARASAAADGVQAAAPACPATPAPLPSAWAAWAMPVAIRSGATLPIGNAGLVTLVSAPRFAVAPDKTPAADSFGGTIAFTVTVAGTYRVGLGGPVWIDVVRNGKPVASVAHDHGPACSPIRKMVDFALTPGRYALQMSGAKTAGVTVMVAKR